MEIVFRCRRCISISALILAMNIQTGDAQSVEHCFAGDHNSGFLEFQGAVEGSEFTGRFGRFEVDYCMPEGDPVRGRIEVRVNLRSADSSNRDRDQTLMDEEFFYVEEYPESTWASHSIRAEGEGYVADGELVLKGISGDQQVHFTLQADGEARVVEGGFSMQGDSRIDRQRFNVGTGEFADPEFVRNRVDVEFEIELQPVR